MKMTLARYLRKKSDGIDGEIPQLIHMLKKSFSAINFRTFWRHWNPIYSYVLTYYVYKPLRKFLPAVIARSLTFIINGVFHDIVVSLILGRVSFSVTILFCVYAGILFIEDLLKLSLNDLKSRVIYNGSLLIIPFLIIIWLN